MKKTTSNSAMAKKITALYKQANKIERQADALLQRFAEAECPWKVGSIISQRDVSGRLHYFSVESVHGMGGSRYAPKPWWQVTAVRSTKTGLMRGGTRWIRDAAAYELVKL